MIDQIEMMRLIENLRGNAIVVPAMRANVGWSEVSNNISRDVPASGAMGKTCSFALGLALARPDTKVIVFDGDGSLLMNLGSLVTTATKAPKNFYHFVMDNGVYATTGGQEVPGAGITDYAEMGRSAGYANAHQFDNLEDFATQISHIMNEEGPVLVACKTIPNIRYSEERASASGPVTRRTPEAIATLMADFSSSH
jgi:sulfopyruvate decarboxylase subunit beta